MVPAAAMGLDVPKFLKTTYEMVTASGATSAADKNPGVILGAILGAAAKQGRDKLTIITSPGIYDLGAWLEQLLAESTGKIGKGIIPVDREKLSKPASYGNDRVFGLFAPRIETEQSAGRRGRRTRKGWASCRPHQASQYSFHRPGIFSLGNRHRRRRLDYRHQRLQSARRRSQQNRKRANSPPNMKRPAIFRRIALLRSGRREAFCRRKKPQPPSAAASSLSTR